jgi:hypothetical protein
MMFLNVSAVAGLVVLVVSSSIAAPLEPDECSCVRVGKQTQCNNACVQPAKPDVIAALRKRYPDLQDGDINVIDDSKHHYEIIFYTARWHMSCRLLLNPVRFKNCRPIHA